VCCVELFARCPFDANRYDSVGGVAKINHFTGDIRESPWNKHALTDARYVIHDLPRLRAAKEGGEMSIQHSVHCHS
jgi:hypothetical protein